MCRLVVRVALCTCAHVSVFLICTCTWLHTLNVPLHAWMHFPWVYAEEDRTAWRGCHLCRDASADYFYRNVLRVQVCKCLIRPLPPWVSPSPAERTTDGRLGPNGSNGIQREARRNCFICRARLLHTIVISIPQRRKKRETPQWQGNYWFHQKQACW